VSVYLGTIYAELALKMDKFEQQMGKAEKAISDAENRMEKFKKTGERLTKMGRDFTTKVTLPIIGAAAAGAKAFMDFDAAMTNSLSIMGDVTDEMRKRMEETARAVAKETRYSAAQAAEAYYFLASAGMDAAQAIEALPRVARFATAGNFDLARATDLLTDAQSALGLATKDVAQNMRNMERVADVLVKANTLANASVEQFSEALTNKAGAALRLLNKDVEEGVAVLAVFADQGLKGAAAGEALNIVMRDLQRVAIKNKEEFKELGISVFDAQGNMRNIADIIEDLEKVLGGLSDEQMRATLMMLGFQDRSVSAMMALFGTSDAIRKYEGELRNASGVTQEVADKQMQSLAARVDKLKSEIWDVAIAIGERLVPYIEKLMEKVKQLIDWFNNLSPEMQETIIRAALLVAAIGPLLWILGTLFGIVYKVQMGFMFLAKTVIPLLIKGVVLLGKAFLFLVTNPVGLIILAITALIAIGYLLYKNWDKVKEKVIEIWQVIKDWFIETWEAIKAWFADTWQSMKNKAIEIWEGIKTWLIETWGSIKQKAIDIWEGIKNWLVTTWENIKQTAINIWEGIIQWFKDLPERIKEGLIRLGEFLLKLFTEDIPYWLGYAVGWFIRKSIEMIQIAWQTGKEIVTGIITFLMELPGKVWEWLVQTKDKLIEFAVEAWNRGVEIGSNILDAIITFVKELPGRVWEWLKVTGENLRQFAVEAWQRGVEIGSNVLNAVITFFRELPGRIWEWLKNTSERLHRFSVEAWQKGIEMGSNFLNAVITYLRDLPGRVWEWLVGTITRITSFATDAYTHALNAGRNIINGIVGTIRDLPNMVWNILMETARKLLNIGSVLWENARRAASSLWNGFKKGLGISSPSYIERALDNIIDKSDETLSKLRRDFNTLSGLKVQPQIAALPLGIKSSPLAVQGASAAAGHAVVNINSPIAVFENIQVRDDRDIQSLQSMMRQLYEETIKSTRARGR
jgi:TP901 family phage tail tape measure protein